MKVGDYVGWREYEEDLEVINAGIILETRTRQEEWGDDVERGTKASHHWERCC